MQKALIKTPVCTFLIKSAMAMCAGNVRMQSKGCLVAVAQSGTGLTRNPQPAGQTLPAWDSPVSAVALKDGCRASSLTTSSPVYPLAPSTAMRWVFLVDPFEPAMLGLLGACRANATQSVMTAQGWLNRAQRARTRTDWGNNFAFELGPEVLNAGCVRDCAYLQGLWTRLGI